MKCISASIVVLAGAILIAFGSFVPHNDTQLFNQIVGIFVGIAGLVGWFSAFRSEK
jgi:hypothetical protein